MKQPEENMDLMMFDYLEGNLEGTESDNFEQKLLVDDHLQEELELWKTSYIQSDFYDTSALESKIIVQTDQRYPFTFYLNMFLILCLSFISSTHYEATDFTPLSREPVQIEPAFFNQPKSNHIIPAQIEIPLPIREAMEEPQSVRERSVFVKEQQPLFNIPDIQNEPIKPIHASIQSAVTKPGSKSKLSKKERRKINKAYQKLKRENDRKQLARPFVKGNIPYVVPLNTENF